MRQNTTRPRPWTTTYPRSRFQAEVYPTSSALGFCPTDQNYSISYRQKSLPVSYPIIIVFLLMTYGVSLLLAKKVLLISLYDSQAQVGTEMVYVTPQPTVMR